MISIDPDLLAALIAAVFGGGGMFALFMRWLEARRGRPLSELVSLAEIQKQIREEVRNENAGLRKDISNLRAALVALTGVIDELLPSLHVLTDEQKSKLDEANSAAKLAM